MLLKKSFIGLIAYFVVGIVLLTTGCKSTKKVVYEGPIPERSNDELWSALSSHNYDFDWYACKAGINVSTPDESFGGTSYIRIKKDSIVWAVVKKLSVEGARILITPDTYAAIDRMAKTYQKGDTREQLEKAGITLGFEDLQQAMFGNIIIPDSSTTQINQEGIYYSLKAIDEDLQLTYWINAYTLELEKTKIIDYRGREILSEFSKYKEVLPGYKAPYYRKYTMPYDERGEAEIALKLKKIEIDIPKKTKFTIESNYQKVD